MVPPALADQAASERPMWECRVVQWRPPETWPEGEDGARTHSIALDADEDRREDELVARFETQTPDGSAPPDDGLNGTIRIRLDLAGGREPILAEMTEPIDGMLSVVPVPSALVENSLLRGVIESVFFQRLCRTPEPRLERLLYPDAAIAWVSGEPRDVVPYTLFTNSAELLAHLGSDATAAWVRYGHRTFARHSLRELDESGPYRLLGSAHGVALVQEEPSRHAWIYVGDGAGANSEEPTVLDARFEMGKVVIELVATTADSRPEIRVDLTPR